MKWNEREYAGETVRVRHERRRVWGGIFGGVGYCGE